MSAIYKYGDVLKDESGNIPLVVMFIRYLKDKEAPSRSEIWFKAMALSRDSGPFMLQGTVHNYKDRQWAHVEDAWRHVE